MPLVRRTGSLVQPDQVVGKGMIVLESGGRNVQDPEGKNTPVPASNQTKSKQLISLNARKRQI